MKIRKNEDVEKRNRRLERGMSEVIRREEVEERHE